VTLLSPSFRHLSVTLQRRRLPNQFQWAASAVQSRRLANLVGICTIIPTSMEAEVGPRAAMAVAAAMPNEYISPAAASASASASASSTSPSLSSVATPSAALPAEVTSFLSILRSHSIRCVVFDLDRTLVSLHSGGSVSASELSTFARSLSPAARLLIPALVHAGIGVAVATFADDLYSTFKRHQVAGLPLVRRVLGELECFRDESKLDDVHAICLNPDLYSVEVAYRSATAIAEQKRMKSAAATSSSSSFSHHSSPRSNSRQSFFHAKLSQLGFSPSDAHWTEVSVYPPPPFKTAHLTLLSKKLNVPLNQMMLIDDSDDNVMAAAEAGAYGLRLTKKRGLLLSDLTEPNIIKAANIHADNK